MDVLKKIELLENENKKLNSVIETLKETNKLLISQKYRLEKDLDEYSTRIDKAMEFTRYLYKVNALSIKDGFDDITEYLDKYMEIFKGDK